MMADEPNPLRRLLDDLDPVLSHVRFMHRFFRDVIEELPETKPIAPELRSEYETMFNAEYQHDTYRLAALAVELLNRGKPESSD